MALRRDARLHGSTGSAYWAGADATTKLELAGAHGVALAELHEAAFEVPGPYDETQQMFVAVEDFGVWTLGQIEALRTRARGTTPLAVDAERYIDMLIESCSPAFTEPFVPVLVHHDFSLANTSYERIDGQLRATGVFDLGVAHIGDGEEDLVRFRFRRKREQREAFVATYSARHPFRPGAGDRIALHALADLLFIWEVSKRVTNWFGDASFVDTAEAVVDTVRMIDTNTRPRPS
ncbi:MAG: phosphotransferase [Acidimicrobiia bacterium]